MGTVEPLKANLERGRLCNGFLARAVPPLSCAQVPQLPQILHLHAVLKLRFRQTSAGNLSLQTAACPLQHPEVSHAVQCSLMVTMQEVTTTDILRVYVMISK